MPYTEEVPQNYKPRLDCKNRACPMQDYFEDKTKGKRYFKYQCKDIALWMKCLRQVPPNAKTDKAEAKTEPTPPAKPAPEIGGYPCPKCSFLAATESVLKTHLEFAHNPPPQPEPEPEPEPEPQKKL